MNRRLSPRADRSHSPLRSRTLRVEALEERRLMAIAVAENLLVELDARHPTAGSAFWTNTGSALGDFQRFGGSVALQSFEGNPAVMLNQSANGDYYQGPPSPDGIEAAGTRSIEAWVFNPTAERAEETMVAWGRRGSTNQNLSFNFGTNAGFGAVGHWANDMGWNGNPTAGTWHHLVYTYDGTNARVYADGALKNTLALSLNTFADFEILIGAQHVNGSTPAQNPSADTSGITGTLAIGQVRIHDGVLSQGQITNNFNEDAARYGKQRQGSIAPVHRYSFATDGIDSISGANATLLNGAAVTGGQLILNNTLNSDDPAGQYATLPISATLAGSNELTMEAWFTLTDTPAWQRLYDFGNGVDNHMFLSANSGRAGNTLDFEYKNGANTTQLIEAPSIPLNTQTHAATVIDVASNTSRLYVNGQLVATDFSITPFSPVALGSTARNALGRSFFNDPYFRGRINEFRVYDEALTSDQLLSSFNRGPDTLDTAPTAAPESYSATEGVNGLNVTTTTAYAVPAGTNGNQDHNFQLGMDFDVNQPVTITQLGAFDSGSNGINGTITVRLYNRVTQEALATQTFTGTQGTLVGGSRFLDLAAPLFLPAGFQGVIAAEGYNAAELNGNSGTPPWTTNTGGGAVSFVGLSRYSLTTGVFPASTDGGPANRYAAGTFNFTTGATPPIANDSDANGDAIRIVPSFSTSIINANFNNNATPSGVFLNRGEDPGAALIQNGRLELTPAANDQMGTAIISKPSPNQLLQGFNASFDLLIGGGGGGGADGISFVYGDLADTARFGEQAPAFTGLQVVIDTYDNGGDGPAFSLFLNNTLIKRVNVSEATVETNTFVPIAISVSPDGVVTLSHNGVQRYQVQLPTWNPQANWRFGMGARTGGANDNHWVDNLQINGLVNTGTSALGAAVAINPDGTFTYNGVGAAGVEALAAGQVANDTFTYAISDGALITTGTITVTVTGVNDPVVSASAGGPYSIVEGTDLTLSASAVDTDSNNVLTYAWDLDNDGQFDDATGVNPTVTWAALGLMTNPITDNVLNAPIKVRATDPSGTSQDGSSTLTVTNKIPTLVIGGPTAGVIGQPLDFTFTATDLAVDQAAGFDFAIDLDGNGSFETTITDAIGAQLRMQTFSAPGTYTIRATATDDDGGTSVVATHVVTIATAVDDNGTLIVGGSGGSDRIVIQPGPLGVKVTVNGKVVGQFPGVTEGMIFGGAGNDTITIGKLQMAFTIDGGDQNDYITGGPLGDTIIGGGGDDRLIGGGGDDFIFGGDGRDTLDGGAGGDTLDGEEGNDGVRGGIGNDTAFGGAGHDRINGDNGNDILLGGAGADIIDGGAGNDALGGDEDSDKLYGRAGNDVLVGGDAMDYLYGGAGDDLVLGSLAGDASEDGLYDLLVAWQSATGSTEDKANDLLAFVGADEDTAGDTLYGEVGGDWFLVFLNDTVHQTDRKSPNYTSGLG